MFQISSGVKVFGVGKISSDHNTNGKLNMSKMLASWDFWHISHVVIP